MWCRPSFHPSPPPSPRMARPHAHALLALCAATAVGGVPYTNPVLPGDYPDPGVIYDPAAGEYVMVNTGRFTLRASRDLVHWAETGQSYYTAPPAWTDPGFFWAPEIHKVNATHYAVMYSAPFAHTGVDGSAPTHQLSVGIGYATAVRGPYTDLGRPIVTSPDHGNIDQSFFRDPVTQRNYLLYKRDTETPRSGSTPMYVVEVNQAADAWVGAPVMVLNDSEAWERVPNGGLSNVEAPWMVYQEALGYYYLFYSAGMYDGPYYSVGVARATSPVGPFTKFRGPILHTRWGAPYITGVDRDCFGPGHPSVLRVGRAADDAWAMIYHAWNPNKQPAGRHVMLDRVVWRDGWPRVEGNTPSFEAVDFKEL